MGCLFLLFVCLSCGKAIDERTENKQREEREVKVNFFNESSFKVDIYRNINPSSLDKSTHPIATIPAGSFRKLSLTESKDKTVGDVFYIRYYVQLADDFDSDVGSSLYVQAERSISNISFVLEAGKTYTKTIVQPGKDELKFVNGYIKVQNTGDAVLQVVNGDVFLSRLGKIERNLESGKFGFYEFAIPPIEENIRLSNLKIFVVSNGDILNIPSFVLERGKIYNFQCDAREVILLNVKDIRY